MLIVNINDHFHELESEKIKKVRMKVNNTTCYYKNIKTSFELQLKNSSNTSIFLMLILCASSWKKY